MVVNFDCSETDRQLIAQIADRFMELCTKYKTHHNRKDTIIDLTACHCNGCRLNLVAMFNGDDFNLLHDVCGITSHIDMATGELEGGFLPRYALKDRSNNTKRWEPKKEHIQ